MSLRGKIDALTEAAIRFGAASAADTILKNESGPDPCYFETVQKAAAAIEAERPAIEAAERERLAKAAEGYADIDPDARPVWLTHDEWRAVAGWIHSQGDTAQP